MRAELGRLLWRRRGRLALVVAALTGAAALELVPPLVVRRVIDHNLAGGRVDGLAAAAWVFFATTVGRHVLTLAYAYRAAAIAQEVLHDLRVRVVDHVSRLPLRHHDETPVGDTISRCTADLDTFQELISRGFVTVAGEAAPLVLIAGAMVALSPRLSLIAVVVVPPVVLTGRFIRARVRQAQRDNRAAVGALAAHVVEDVSGIEVIKAFDRHEVFTARFRAALRRSLVAFDRANVANTFYGPLISVFAAVITTALLWNGTGAVSVGTLTAFVLLFQRFVQPVTTLGEEWQRVQAAMAGAERVFATLALPVDDPPAAGSAAPPGPAPQRPAGIELRDVTFGYQAGTPVLRGIDLVIRPGEHVAIVGRTGAGKSTLLELIGGLRRPWTGTVHVGGVDPADLDDDQRRRLFGVALQRVQLVGATVHEAITFGDPGVAPEQVEGALRLVGADTLGPGLPVSAGERRRLALARAVVLTPAVLLLDEAAGGDARERVVGAGDFTVVSISHELAHAMAADRAVVVADGAIVEEGRPADLVRKGGLFAAYAELSACQGLGTVSAEG